MEWFTLDASLRQSTVIEGFRSFIWSERYSLCGDFQIVTRSTPSSRALLSPGTNVGMRESRYVMIIETASDKLAEDGGRNLTVTGRSMEKILDDRVAMPLIDDLTSTPKWSVTGTPGDIARYLFDQVCVTGVLSANDTIPFYHAGTFLPAGTIAEPSETFVMDFDPDTLYKDLAKICEIWPLGFRLVRNGEASEIYFDVYTGNDRTSRQTLNSPVIFSPDMETIGNTETLKSVSSLKTVAYVFAQNDATIVYASGYDSSVSGAERRVLLVKADDIDLPAGSALTAAMTQRGMEELAKYRDVNAFAGEIPQHLPYVYGIDYGLGDLVEEQGLDGYVSQMLVTEQIFISDQEGERTYPTLVISDIIVPGSWRAEPVTEHWNDVAADRHWDDA